LLLFAGFGPELWLPNAEPALGLVLGRLVAVSEGAGGEGSSCARRRSVAEVDVCREEEEVAVAVQERGDEGEELSRIGDDGGEEAEEWPGGVIG
jgi:hypothetical protein